MPPPSPPFSPLTTLYQKWKTLKLPWRRRWLAGTDLAGNTFWYFRPSLAPSRPRRILQHNRQTPYSDIEISPAWHQWLRGTREAPPSWGEQVGDVRRREELRGLVERADRRWEAKGSVLDGVGKGREGRELGGGEGEGEGKVVGEGERGKENPWAQRRGSAGEGWQPEAWRPGPTNR